MRRNQAIIYLFTLVALTETVRINYCGSRMCGNTDTHTFCQYSRRMGPNCIGFIEARLSSAEKNRILTRLNRRRNEAASGKLRGLPTAGNMLRLRWVEELAREAQIWANQCHPPQIPEAHDSCRDLYSVTVGQCVASVVGDAPGLKVESMVDMWYMQGILYKGNVSIYVPPLNNRYHYEDFGQLVWSKTYMVGCGRSRFMAPSLGRLRSVERLVCNFAPKGPAYYRPLWTPSGPASDCPARARRHTTHTALCDYQYELSEYNDKDHTMSLEDHLLLNTVLELERNESYYEEGALDDMFLNVVYMAKEQSVPTEYANLIQKRDVADVYDTSMNGMVTGPSLFETTSTPILIKFKLKANTIGRPKSYKMEDLSLTEEPKEENIEFRTHKIDVEVYGEYNLEDNNDKEESTTSTATDVKDIIDTQTEITVKPTLIEIHANGASPIEFETVSETIDKIIEQESGSNSSEPSTYVVMNNSQPGLDRLDEYLLSDPETVKELEAALQRMESEAAKTPALAGKPARNLEDFTLQTSPYYVPKSNLSVDKSSMMSMVLKYMPYLKDYERELIGTNSCESCRTYSFILYIVIYFIL